MKRLRAAAFIWLLGCSAAGFAVGSALDNHGELLFLMFGIFFGVIGATTHCVLLLSSRYRQRTMFWRVLILGPVTYIVFRILLTFDREPNQAWSASFFANVFVLLLIYSLFAEWVVSKTAT